MPGVWASIIWCYFYIFHHYLKYNLIIICKTISGVIEIVAQTFDKIAKSFAECSPNSGNYISNVHFVIIFFVHVFFLRNSSVILKK